MSGRVVSIRLIQAFLVFELLIQPSKRQLLSAYDLAFDDVAVMLAVKQVRDVRPGFLRVPADQLVVPAVTVEPGGRQWDELLVGAFPGVEGRERFGFCDQFVAVDAFSRASPLREGLALALLAWVGRPPVLKRGRVRAAGFIAWIWAGLNTFTVR